MFRGPGVTFAKLVLVKVLGQNRAIQLLCRQIVRAKDLFHSNALYTKTVNYYFQVQAFLAPSLFQSGRPIVMNIQIAIVASNYAIKVTSAKCLDSSFTSGASVPYFGCWAGVS